VRPAARPGPVVELEDEGVALAVVCGVVRAAAGGAWPWALGVFSRAPLYSCIFHWLFSIKKRRGRENDLTAHGQGRRSSSALARPHRRGPTTPRWSSPPSAACAAARKVLGWPKKIKFAHAFLEEYSYRRLKLAQFLHQLGVFLTFGRRPSCRTSARACSFRQPFQDRRLSVNDPQTVRIHRGV
jgi:hypothetical protein